MSQLIERDGELAETAFADLLSSDPSPLRLALLAERSVRRGNQAGGVLLLEQDAESGALGEHGAAVAEMLGLGREQLNEADDGWYFASIGQFPIARANFEALLDQDPDAVALLEFADADKRRALILIQLADDEIMGPVVKRVLQSMQRGEQLIKGDPVRIKQNIDRLDGPPRAYENASSALIESGEFAVPFLLQVLADSDQQHLTRPILRVLPDVGRRGLNPLVLALRMESLATRRYVIDALGQIGYAQAVPYLLALREQSTAAPEIRAAVEAALNNLASLGAFPAEGASASQAFYALARAYYDDAPSLAADVTLDTANVWYYRDGLLENVEVPTDIFNEIMTMRCCEEALRLDSEFKPAIALWLAADFRREAQLGSDQVDYSRPENTPPASYYAQSAGSEYCQLALARAIDDDDAAVALGAILALRKTAGTASLLGANATRQPLAEALSFPGRMVRIQAALALGAAEPDETFRNGQNLLPVLGEALQLVGGQRTALVVDSDQNAANDLVALLGELEIEAASDTTLFNGLQKVRGAGATVDVILLASDTTSPSLEDGIAQIRGEFRFGSTPLLIIAKPADRERAVTLARRDSGVGFITGGIDADTLATAIDSVSKAVGSAAITAETGRSLALESAAVLRRLAARGNSAFNPTAIEPALLAAFGTTDAELRVAVANVLAYLPSAEAQSAIAAAALDTEQPDELRIAMFGALSTAGKHNGNQLPTDLVKALIDTVQSGAGDIQSAASQAMGALNLAGNPASELIRNQYQG
jgi:tetratricopeptide (TPR) repeat protein